MRVKRAFVYGFAGSPRAYSPVNAYSVSKRFFAGNFFLLHMTSEKTSLLDRITCEETWREFFLYKTEHELLGKKQRELFSGFIENKSYERIAREIRAGTYVFKPPLKHDINKAESTKKRTVYTYSEEETMLLRLIGYLLYEYDGIFSPSLYSFRKNTGAKRAVDKLIKTEGISEMYACKTDISDYFNSIDTAMLLKKLKAVFASDNRLYLFFEKLLCDGRCVYNGEVCNVKKGAMAGTPTSVFFANVLLSEMDFYFSDRKIPYARYSDDIIVFGSYEEVLNYKKTIEEYIKGFSLRINEEKSCIFTPEEGFSYLGFSYKKGVTDISDVSKRKLKAKIRRQARSFYRWRIKNGVAPDIAVKTFIRKFNRKFFSAEQGNELCWSRWFFPVINTDSSLKELDRYMQEQIRYVACGRHNKTAYKRTSYGDMKALGYISLVNAYHKYKKPR